MSEHLGRYLATLIPSYHLGNGEYELTRCGVSHQRKVKEDRLIPWWILSFQKRD